MGDWVAAHTASHDQDLIGAILICMGDMGRVGGVPRQKEVELMADNMEALRGVTAESMADEVLAHAKEFRLDSERAASGLAQIRLLALTSDDGLAGDTEARVHAIEAKGGKNVKTISRRNRPQLVRQAHLPGEHDYFLALRIAVIRMFSYSRGAQGGIQFTGPRLSESALRQNGLPFRPIANVRSPCYRPVTSSPDLPRR